MKTEWQFRFEARGFRFSKEHKYRLTPKEAIDVGDGPEAGLEFRVRIVPSDDEPPPRIDQTGWLHVLLPFRPEKGRTLAEHLAWRMTQQIMFAHGDFRINFAICMWKRIAETPDEEAEIGDAPYGASFSIVEYIDPPTFNSKSIEQLSNANVPPGLLAQFNEAKAATSPLIRFLGFFRVLEGLFVPEGARLKAALKNSDKLRQCYAGITSGGNFEAFVDQVVEARHQCAHLRQAGQFGIAPGDPSIQKLVIPHLDLLESLAARCLTPG